MLKWNFLVEIVLCALPLTTTEKTPGQSPLRSPQVLTQAGRTPLSTLLQAELSQLSQPRLTHRSSSPLAPPGPFTSHRLSCTGAEPKEQPRSSTCWQCFPAQPSTPLTCVAARTPCWCMVHLSTGTPEPFCEASPQPVPPQDLSGTVASDFSCLFPVRPTVRGTWSQIKIRKYKQ